MRDLATRIEAYESGVTETVADSSEPSIHDPASRDPLTESQIPEDAYFEALYRDMPSVETVRDGDGRRRVVSSGIRPFFARLFADGPVLDISQLKTRERVEEGAYSEVISVDPMSETAVEHHPATLKRRMPVWHRLGDPDSADIADKALYGALTLGALALPLIGWQVAGAILGAPIIGAVVGLFALAIEGHTAEDGWIDYEPAARGFTKADTTLTVLQNELSEAKTIEEFEQIAWEERSRTALEARDVEARRDKSTLQILNEDALGMGLSVVDADESLSPAVGGPDEDTPSAARADGGEDVEGDR